MIPLPLWIQTAGATFWDDFNRADTEPGDLGACPTGRVWDMRGPWQAGPVLPPAKDGCVRDGRFAASSTAYACQRFAATPGRMGGVVRFEQAAGKGGECTVALLSSANNAHILDMLHVIINRSMWAVQVRQAAGEFETLAMGPLALELNVDYVVNLGIYGDTAILYIDGGLVATVTDERIETLAGPYCVWELYYTDTPSITGCWRSVWAGQ